MFRRPQTSASPVRPLLAALVVACGLGIAAPASAQISGELEGITKPFEPRPLGASGGCSATPDAPAGAEAGLLLLAGLARRQRR